MIPTTRQKEFYEEFHQRTGDSVAKLLMAKIIGTPSYHLLALGLELSPGQDGLWGLLIFGQKSIHFFAPATEGSLAAMLRLATNGSSPKEQHLCIPRSQILLLEQIHLEPGILSPIRFLPFLRGKSRLLKLQFNRQDSSANKKRGDGTPMTLTFETVQPLETLTPFLRHYLEQPVPNAD